MTKEAVGITGRWIITDDRGWYGLWEQGESLGHWLRCSTDRLEDILNYIRTADEHARRARGLSSVAVRELDD